MAKLAGILTAFVVLSAGQGEAQEAGPQARLEMDRTELTNVLDQLQSILQSTAYSQELRDGVRLESQLVLDRLTDGDFRVGDEVALFIEGESAVWDTLSVEVGPQITLATMGVISLHGVLRSELEGHLTREVGRFIQDPRVRAQGLVRISVEGAVGSPGFYTVPANMLLSDLLMFAGGPGAGDIEKLHINRGRNLLWEPEILQEMIVAGRTLDELGLFAGDRIILPEDGASGVLGQIWRPAALVATSVFLGRGIF